MEKLFEWSDRNPYVSHALGALAWMAMVAVTSVNPFVAAMVPAAYFFARAQREHEYAAGRKYLGSFLPWNWSQKLIGAFLPAVVAAMFSAIMIALYLR